jgi:hypothetical protein
MKRRFLAWWSAAAVLWLLLVVFVAGWGFENLVADYLAIGLAIILAVTFPVHGLSSWPPRRRQ